MTDKREMQGTTERTRQRQAEMPEQADKADFRATFEQAGVGLGHVAPDGRWLLVNPKLCEITGYDASELTGRRIGDMLPADNQAVYKNGAQSLLSGRSESAALETGAVHKNGAVVWLALTVSLSRAEPDADRYFIVVVEDISARKAAQDALKRAQTDLETLNTRLKRAMAETHHRVKNNLQIISALVELQMQEGVEQVPASALARVGQHARALALLHDLLTWEAKGEAEMDTISAREALDRMVPLIQATSGGRRIRYSVPQEMQMPVKTGASLALLINELVSNALKHGQGDIELQLTLEDGAACLEVRDDGPGFPDGFSSEQAANTGLELVESIGRWDLGGETLYETRPEGGARVCITFPLYR